MWNGEITSTYAVEDNELVLWRHSASNQRCYGYISVISVLCPEDSIFFPLRDMVGRLIYMSHVALSSLIFLILSTSLRLHLQFSDGLFQPC